MAKKIYALANWKMNTTLSEAMVLAGNVLKKTYDDNRVQVVFLPPSIWLVPLRERYRKINLGAQNIYSHTKGAYTGEISASMLKGIAKYVLIGHSERRTVFGEDDAFIRSKIQTALKSNLTPVLAIGEEQKIKIDGKTEKEIMEIVKSSSLGKSLIACTRGLSESDWKKILVAYEPIWAIGTGDNAKSEYAASIARALRQIIKSKTNQAIASDVPILYGGSVTRHSAADYISHNDIDGVLVGSASLKSAEFSAIVESMDSSIKWRENANN